MNDLISRTAAIDNLMEILDRPNHAEFLYTDEICGVLRNLPSVQPRKGKWIDDGTEFGCCCSECNYTLDDYFYGELREVALTKLMNFCPNCGADMRGDSDDR